MKCTSPINLTISYKKSTIGIPKGTGTYTVPCGQCMACKVNRTTEWQTRILHESRCHDDNIWITLTYNDSNLPENSSLKKRDLQLFFKKLRRYKNKFRYFASGEYGENYKRPHYHCILFGISLSDMQLIEKVWGKGFVHGGRVNAKTAAYTAKYVQKQLYGAERQIYDITGIEREFSISSRKPGIGSTFAERYIDEWLQNGYIIINGSKKPIPRYYLTKASKQKITFHRERYQILGFKAKILKAQEENKTLYQLSDQEVADRSQRELNIKTKAQIYDRKKL